MRWHRLSRSCMDSTTEKISHICVLPNDMGYSTTRHSESSSSRIISGTRIHRSALGR